MERGLITFSTFMNNKFFEIPIYQRNYSWEKEQLEDLQKEISELRDVLNLLNSVISSKSFHSADEIYSKLLIKKPTEPNEEEYFVEEIPKEKVEGTNIKRKIFSKSKGKEEELLCILNFYDFNRIEIKFIDPEKRSIQETSEDFIRIFLKGGLIKIKEIKGLDIKFFRIKHGGAPKARNFGFSKSRGEFVLFCDADLELREDCLEKMYQSLVDQ